MADNTDLLKQIKEIVQEEVKPIKDAQQEQGRDIRELRETKNRQTNLLTGITSSVATLLEDHSAQRVAIRTMHSEVHDIREELKEEIHAARDEIHVAREDAKRDTIDLKATVIRQVKDHETRIQALEEEAGIPNPHKH